jgi:hypothetical protein
MKLAYFMIPLLLTGSPLLSREIAKTPNLETPIRLIFFTEVSRGIDKYLWIVEAHAQG